MSNAGLSRHIESCRIFYIGQENILQLLHSKPCKASKIRMLDDGTVFVVTNAKGTCRPDIPMKKACTIALLGLALSSPLPVGAQDAKSSQEELNGLVATAVANNPELKSSESRWQMFTGKARQASSLEDPMLMFKMQNMPVRNPFVFNKDPQSAMVVGLSQQLPFWGKRHLRKRMALSEAESYRWAYEERKLELARMVKETCYRIWAVDKELEIVDRNLRLLGDIVTWTGLRYSVGQGMQQEVHKAGLEKSKMLEMQIALRQQRKSLEANLNYLLYRPGTTPVGPVADFTMPKMTLTAGQLNEIALERRPQLKSLGSLVEKGDAARRLARKESYPDFNLSFEYMFRQPVSTEMASDPGYDMFSVGVSFNLPVWREKRQAMVAESMAETSMSTDEVNALKNSISLTINQGLAELERISRTIELYRGGIIPQAAQSLEATIIGYRVNKSDFGAVLEGRMALFNYQRQLYDMESEYMMKLAELEAATGADLTGSAEGTSGTKTVRLMVQ